MSRGGCSRPELSWNRQLDSGRKRPPRDMRSSQTGDCYGGIDVTYQPYPVHCQQNIWKLAEMVIIQYYDFQARAAGHTGRKLR
eukprot:gene24490-biopygen995